MCDSIYATTRIGHANSVRLSVTRVYCIKTAERIIEILYLLIGPSFQLFVTKGRCVNLTASPPTGAPNTMGQRFSINMRLYLGNGASDPLHIWFQVSIFGVSGANGAISGSLDGGAVARNPCVSWAFLFVTVTAQNKWRTVIFSDDGYQSTAIRMRGQCLFQVCACRRLCVFCFEWARVYFFTLRKRHFQLLKNFFRYDKQYFFICRRNECCARCQICCAVNIYPEWLAQARNIIAVFCISDASVSEISVVSAVTLSAEKLQKFSTFMGNISKSLFYISLQLY